jgi:spermidine synthase
MQVHIEDGRDFIERSEGCYDLIVLDSFDADCIPPHLRTLEFLRSVRQALTPGGIAVANIWGRHSNRLYDSMLMTYRAAFEDLFIFDVPTPGTKIFVALPRKQSMSRPALLKALAQLSDQSPFRAQLDASKAGFRHSDQEQLRAGEVLRD